MRSRKCALFIRLSRYFERYQDFSTARGRWWHNTAMFSRNSGLLCAALLLSFCVGEAGSAQSSADWDWMSNHFPKALDDLFPIDESYGVDVAYRSHRDLHTDSPEYSFVIETENSDTISGLPRYLAAYVREAESASFYDQMMALHRKFPNRSAEHIQRDVHVRKLKLTEMSCPVIRTQFAKLQQLSLTLPQFDVVILHSLIHEFRIRAGAGDMEVALYDDENSLVRWAIETRHSLESCATDSPH